MQTGADGELQNIVDCTPADGSANARDGIKGAQFALGSDALSSSVTAPVGGIDIVRVKTDEVEAGITVKPRVR
jgi:hypothetical protein